MDAGDRHSAARAAASQRDGGDGANNNLGIDRVRRVPTLGDAIVAMQEPLDMGIGGSLDCGSTQPYPPNGTVDEIWVPAASNGTETASYDVSATLTFR